MALTLYYHPFASFCWKVLIALYENDTPFTPVIVDLCDEAQRTAFYKLAPMGKFPVIVDDARGATLPESTIIIEYLQQHYPGRTTFIPIDPAAALQTRLRERFLDAYIHEPMQKIVGDRLRPKDQRDPFGVEEARQRIQRAADQFEREFEGPWAMGAAFSMADCAAAPALHYAGRVAPFLERTPKLNAYFARLRERPSFARVLEGAQPYERFFPQP